MKVDMGTVTRTRPRIGDVIEISTPAGFAYAQYTHKHEKPPRYGALLRVLPGLYASCLKEFGSLVQQKERFLVFFPLGAACNRKLVRVVAEEPIPEWACPFPVFRQGNADANGHVRIWFLWDGEREWRVGTLSEEQRKFPVMPGVWNNTLLVERIAEGWQPRETDS